MQSDIEGFLRQRVDERSTVEHAAGHLLRLQKRIQAKPVQAPAPQEQAARNPKPAGEKK